MRKSTAKMLPLVMGWLLYKGLVNPSGFNEDSVILFMAIWINLRMSEKAVILSKYTTRMLENQRAGI